MFYMSSTLNKKIIESTRRFHALEVALESRGLIHSLNKDFPMTGGQISNGMGLKIQKWDSYVYWPERQCNLYSPRILAHLYGQRRNNCKSFHSSTAHIYDDPVTTY